MAYIGRGLDKISNIEVLDAITFTDSAGPYNLLKDTVAFVPTAANALVISVDGVIQSPDSYTTSVATITFDSVMAASSTMDFMYQIGTGVITSPSDDSVTTAKLANLSVTEAKLATDAVETAKIKDLNVTVGKLPASVDLSTKTITLPASVSGLGTGITNSQLAGSIDVTTKITGVVPTANLGSGTASSSTYLAGNQTYQTISEYNDADIRNDLMTVALKQASQENMTKHNLPNSAVVVFQADADFNLGGSTDILRNDDKYIEAGTQSTGEFTNDGDTLLLLHCDGSDTSTTITDSSSNGYTMTANGNAQLDTAQKKFGTASCLFDGSGDYVSNASTDWDPRFAANDFTIEMWVRGTSFGGNNRFFMSKGGQGYVSADYEGWSFKKNSSDLMLFQAIDNGGTPVLVNLTADSALTWTDDTWYHVALARDVTDAYYFYRDGVNVPLTQTVGTVSTTFDGGTRDLEIGRSADGGAYFNGWIDELRVSSSCRYPGGTTFTPNQSTTVSATGTALGTTNVPSSAVTEVSGVFLMKNAFGTNTLGTDVKVYFTADNSNWTEATSYTSAGTFSTGVTQITLGKTTVTSGSDVRWKIVFANQVASTKVAYVYGIGTNY